MAIADTASRAAGVRQLRSPAVEMIVAALQESRYDTGLDLDLLFEIAEYWEESAQARPLQARRVLAHPYAGVLASGARRHDVATS